MSAHPDPVLFAALPQAVRFTYAAPDGPATLCLEDGSEVQISADTPLTLAPAWDSRMLIVYTPTRSESALYAIPPALTAVVEAYVTYTPPPTVLHAVKALGTVTLTLEGMPALTLARDGLRIQGEASDPYGPPSGPWMVLELFPSTWATEGYYRVRASKETPEGRAALTALGFAHHL